ncbi:MAG: hypothetical protein BAJALOKI2v1_550023 [Promethearchaeota archaeon]|nr:MAG: hypothetical protein BAJALOKI2v1_550023 [Candidatus Lokiarchaeota archaeon]
MVKVRKAYCDYCKKEIEHPAKKPLKTSDQILWAIIILGTLGIGLIAFLIWQYGMKKKHFCPVCNSKLRFVQVEKEKLEQKEQKVLSPKEKVMEKAKSKGKSKKGKQKAQNKEEEKEKAYCPFCGNEIHKDTATCPYCQTAIKF